MKKKNEFYWYKYKSLKYPNDERSISRTHRLSRRIVTRRTSTETYFIIDLQKNKSSPILFTTQIRELYNL